MPRQNSWLAWAWGRSRNPSGNLEGMGSSPTTSALPLRRADSTSARTMRHRRSPGGTRKPKCRGGNLPAARTGSPGLLDRVFERVAGGELGHLGSGDIDPLLGLRVDSLPGVALLDVELAEAGDLDLVALLELRLYHGGESLEELLGFIFRAVGLVGDLLDQLSLVHRLLNLPLPLTLLSPVIRGNIPETCR